jgi:hypothetical protein
MHQVGLALMALVSLFQSEFKLGLPHAFVQIEIGYESLGHR